MTLAAALTPAEQRVLVAWLVEIARDLGAEYSPAPLPGIAWPAALAQCPPADDMDDGEALRAVERARDLVATYRDPGVPDVTARDVLVEAALLAAWTNACSSGVPQLHRDRARVLALASRAAPEIVATIAANAIRRVRWQSVARWTRPVPRGNFPSAPPGRGRPRVPPAG